MTKNLTIEQLQDLIMQQAAEKGFGVTPEEISMPEKIALIHSEISEAYEAYRHNHMTGGKDSFADELGDAVQRILHLAGVLNIDIEAAILEKLAINKTREWNPDKLNENIIK